MQLAESLGALVLLLLPLVSGIPVPGEHVDPDVIIKLSIALEPRDSQLLEDTLYAVSDPASPRYGQHLTREEARALVEPRPESTEAVRRWLAGSDLEHLVPPEDGQFIRISMPAKRAELLFGRDFKLHTRPDGKVARSMDNLVPIDVRQHIASIYSTLDFGTTTVQGSTLYPKFPFSKSARSLDSSNRSVCQDDPESVDLQDCNNTMTPACLRNLYNMDDPPVAAHKNSLFGVAGFLGQTAQYRELEMFVDTYASYARGANFSVEPINNGSNPQGEYPSGEANLNIQYAIGMAHNVPVRFYTNGGEYRDYIPDLDINDPTIASVEPWLEFASYLVDLPDKDLPQVVSISYGINEHVLPKDYAIQTCNLFGQLGTRGVTVVTAAGNTGPGVSCMSNDGLNTTKFLPMFPSSCPYVTSVGGTEGNSPEFATNFSSGGFSEYFRRPRWQDEAVGGFLAEHGQRWKQYYDARGRGYPDLAAQAHNYPIYNDGVVEDADGTSAAAPLFASMIALINNERFNLKKPALGFLNPFIYKHGKAAFTDITQGRSVGCQGVSYWGLPSPIIPDAGWHAVAGWDPITGWGTPLFDRLRTLALCVKKHTYSARPGHVTENE
ncbi:hypothetical protein S40288_06627 [Stachybotrys chartarum IBT 40288]|nr:hypothetical protein S40288_06627 [Stachybotrys chartarum IBT 40288]